MSIIVKYRGVEIERGDKNVLKGVTFSLSKGEFYYLVGRVGSGKSSLMKTMYADVPLYSGDCAEIMGFDLLSIKKSQIPYLRRKIGIVFKATGWNNKNDIDSRIDEVLSMVGMANKSYKMPHELSGGEQQRIVIARALLNKPDLILADEPTGNLDPQTGYQIAALLHQLSNAGHCVVMATHNLQLASDFPGKLMRCEGKQLIVE